MEYFRNDVKSGLFIVIAGALFVIATFMVGGVFEQLRSKRTITLNFENSEQVDAGTEVLYRGKKIGRVQDVTFSSEHEGVDIICAIGKNTELYKGTKARIGDKSALGGKIIELYPPPMPKTGTLDLHNDAEAIIGMPPKGLGAAIEALTSLVQENKAMIRDIISNVNATVVDARAQINAIGDGITSRLAKLDPAIENMGPLVSDARVELKRISDNLNATLDSYKTLADKISDNAAIVTGDLTRTMDDAGLTLEEYRTLAKQLQTQADDIGGELNTLLQDADAVVADNYEGITDSIIALRQTLRNFELFSAKVAETPSALVWGGVDGEAPAELTDEEIFNRELRVSGFIGRFKTENDKRKESAATEDK